ncbi:MAG: nucleotide exchange factor GrpE [Lachnospiraceae bacterium]|nr:nucleotide exchange factor GrpE [Lachnospiraceae bacterium]
MTSNPSSGTANADSEEEDGEEKKSEEADTMKADAAKEETASGESEKKGFFSKKKKEKDKRDQQIEELTDRVQRQMAEFDNFRKRSEKEKSAMFEVGAKSVLEKILPTVDNFERGFANLSEEQKQDAFAQGMEKVYRQLLTALEGIGVKPIEAVGQPFDPNFHNAVMHVEDEEAGENVVVEEFQKGYMYRDNVLRHSMVKVAN